MTHPLIKICGVKTPDILDHVIADGADMVGFNTFAKSPRYIDFATISALVERASGRIEAVVLLVDPDDELVEAAAATGAGWLQLHGRESPERVAAIKAATGKKVIKALPIGGREDIGAVSAHAPIADRLLLDAKPPRTATRPGGLGETFDWTLLETLDPDIAFMLSGGLDIDNVESAISVVRPFGLDVSSGVEREKGVKDKDLITAFIARARTATKQAAREPAP